MRTNKKEKEPVPGQRAAAAPAQRSPGSGEREPLRSDGGVAMAALSGLATALESYRGRDRLVRPGRSGAEARGWARPQAREAEAGAGSPGIPVPRGSAQPSGDLGGFGPCSPLAWCLPNPSARAGRSRTWWRLGPGSEVPGCAVRLCRRLGRWALGASQAPWAHTRLCLGHCSWHGLSGRIPGS